MQEADKSYTWMGKLFFTYPLGGFNLKVAIVKVNATWTMCIK